MAYPVLLFVWVLVFDGYYNPDYRAYPHAHCLLCSHVMCSAVPIMSHPVTVAIAQMLISLLGEIVRVHSKKSLKVESLWHVNKKHTIIT